MYCSDLIAGATEPTLGKKIKEIILAEPSFIVYMDSEDVIQWTTTESMESTSNMKFGEIQNQISYWESLSNRLFTKQESYDYKCLLAEGYARMLGTNNPHQAEDIINKTSFRITERAQEILSQQYLITSLITSGIVALILLCMVFQRFWLRTLMGVDVYDICITGLMGGVGSFVSILLRYHKYNPEITHSKTMYSIDGFIRIVYGILAGLLVGIGIKSNIAFGFIDKVSDKNIYVQAFLGAISGASETILPNLIKQVEEQVAPK